MGGDHFLNLQPGTIINGRYEVVKCLGAGSMGMVYACRHRELAGHIVAMKVLFAEVARDEVAAARFRNEIVASYGVSHPNVVRAYEYFRDGDLIAFTMEYVGGGDLADRIAGDEDIPIEEIISMLCQMASGVQAIHEAGIIHRDLKPENILLTSQGSIKITDFGIARTGTGPKLTEHGGVVGTIDYVSPEYLERGQVDARSDIYELGVLAYEMITGESPFKGKSVIETMTMRLRTDPKPPHHVRMDCPVTLSNIVLKAMARDPELRYQEASEVLEDLQELRSQKKAQKKQARLSPQKPVAEESSRSAFVYSEKELPFTTSGTAEFSSAFEESDDDVDENDSRTRQMTEQIFDQGLGDERKSLRTRTATLQLRRDDVSELVGSGEYPEDGMSYEEDYRMESVLSAREWIGEHDVGGREERSIPSVGVSQSSLSADRIKELSLDLYQPRSAILRTVLYWAFVGFVGFGVGMLLLKHYKPELFDVTESRAGSGYSVDN